MKRIVIFAFCLLLLFGCSAPEKTPPQTPVTPSQTPSKPAETYTNSKWTLVESVYKTNEYSAVNFFVSLSGAVGDGVFDDTSAIQTALDRAGKAGGGSVYIAKGKYRVTRPIIIPDNVSLIGDFVSPTSKKPSEDGTVIIVAESEALLGDSVFLLSDGSALSELTVWYEGQTFASMRQYPYTVRHASGVSASVTNIAIINTYNGISVSSPDCEKFYLENIYMTAFKNAVRVVSCSEKLTVKGVSVSPVYWVNDSMTVKPDGFDVSVTNDAIYSNLTAITLEGVGDANITDVTVDTAHVGLNINISDNGDKSPMFSLVNISNAYKPVLIEKIPYAGACFALCSFTTSNLLGSVSVEIGENFDSVLSFNSCSFPGQPSRSVKSDGKGRLSFVNCRFIGWRDTALELSDIIFTAVNSSFNAGSQPVRISEKTAGMLALCSSAAVPETEGSSLYVISTDNEYEFYSLEKTDFTASVSSPELKKAVYDVSDYGLSEAAEDNTSAIQSAINYAYKNGGGTVFIPAGQYRLKSVLRLKKGVKLRGVGSGTNPLTATVLITETNAGNASNLITLESSTALTDITLYYYKIPDLSSADAEYEGNAVYAMGQSEILVENVCLVRPCYGIFLNGCSSVSVKNISGTALVNGVRLDSCIDIVAENIEFGKEFATSDSILTYCQSNFSAMYVYGGESITIRNLGCVNADYAISLDDADVPLVPSTPSVTVSGLFSREVYASVAVGKYPFVSVVNVASRPSVFITNAYHVTTFSGNRGRVNIYNLLGSGNVTGGIYARSGSVSVQSSAFYSLGKSALITDGATAYLIGSMLLDNNCTYHVEANTGAAFLLGNVTNPEAAFAGIEAKYVRRYVSDDASYADDGNIRGILPE